MAPWSHGGRMSIYAPLWASKAPGILLDASPPPRPSFHPGCGSGSAVLLWSGSVFPKKIRIWIRTAGLINDCQFYLWWINQFIKNHHTIYQLCCVNFAFLSFPLALLVKILCLRKKCWYYVKDKLCTTLNYLPGKFWEMLFWIRELKTWIIPMVHLFFSFCIYCRP